MSLKGKLSLVLGGLTALLFFAGSVFLVHQVSQGLIASATTTLKARALVIAGNASDAQSGSGSGGESISIQSGNNAEVSSHVGISGTPFAVSAASSSVTLIQIVKADSSVVAHFGSAVAVLSAPQVREALVRPLAFAGTLGGAARNQLVVVEAVPGSANLVILAGTPLSPVETQVARTIWFLLVLGIGVVALASAAGYALSRAALRPVERMREAAAAMTESETSGVLAVSDSNDEIAHLGTTLNDLLGRISRASSRQRGFVAIAGHELRTPLSILKVELELAGRGKRTQAQMRQAIGAAARETDRLIRMTEQLLTLAKGDEAQLAQNPEPFSARDTLGSVCASFTSRARAVGVGIKILPGDDVRCFCDLDAFHQVFSNIIENAIRFSPVDSTVGVMVRQVGTQVEIKVSDQGPGFDPAVREVAFERFARGSNHNDSHSEGSGLGLSVVKTFVVANGGSVDLGNSPTGGAWVAVTLPLAPMEIGRLI